MQDFKWCYHLEPAIAREPSKVAREVADRVLHYARQCRRFPGGIRCYRSAIAEGVRLVRSHGQPELGELVERVAVR